VSAKQRANVAWLLAIAVVIVAYFWAPWPADWITTILVVAVIVLVFIMERLA
jgi:diacylglycerol kinase